jgi:hypothetical protein
MSDPVEAVENVAAANDLVAPARLQPHLQLPEFWVETPAAWFAYVESKFRLKGVPAETDCYDYLVAALPRASVRRVLDLLERPDANQPYSRLKERLLVAHEPTNFQRIEKLHQMGPLGDRAPSELLAEMI